MRYFDPQLHGKNLIESVVVIVIYEIIFTFISEYISTSGVDHFMKNCMNNLGFLYDFEETIEFLKKDVRDFATVISPRSDLYLEAIETLL